MSALGQTEVPHGTSSMPTSESLTSDPTRIQSTDRLGKEGVRIIGALGFGSSSR